MGRRRVCAPRLRRGFRWKVGKPCGAGAECEGEGAEVSLSESGGVEQGRGVRGGKLGFVFLLR